MASRFTDRLRSFYEESRQGLFTYALSLARDRDLAEDAVQAAFFGLLRCDRLPRDLRPYVFRSVRHAVIDGQRAARTRALAVESESAPEPANEDPIRDHALNQCLSRVPAVERETIILKIFCGLTLAEIGGIDGTSINTVASRYRRGLERMRKMLEGEP